MDARDVRSHIPLTSIPDSAVSKRAGLDGSQQRQSTEPGREVAKARPG